MFLFLVFINIFVGFDSIWLLLGFFMLKLLLVIKFYYFILVKFKYMVEIGYWLYFNSFNDFEVLFV